MKRIVWGMLALVMCSCTLGPKYQRPKNDVPTHWKAPVCEQPHESCSHWWTVFNDPTLNKLEEKAVQQNFTVYVALQRVMEARAVAGIREADLFPQLNLGPNYSDSVQLYKIFFPIPGTTTNLVRAHEVQYEIPLNLSYELDLWGKIKGQYQSAVLSAQAEQEALRTALLTLTTELASCYYQMRTFDTQIDVLKKRIAVNKQQLALVEERFKKGLVNYMDVTNASLALSDLESIYFDTIRQRQLQENQIAILLGMPASCLHMEHRPLIGLPPCVPAHMPSTVLCKRPDIAEAERTMASEHAMIGVAYASYFPSIELTGALGSLSPMLKPFLTWPSRLWAYGANMNQVIFDAGRTSSNVDATWARYREACGDYRQTVLTAFREVEDALINLDMQAKQSVSLEHALQASAKANELVHHRYQAGLANYLDVISSEQSELEALTDYNNILGVRFLSTVQLIKATGGSW